ncbi:unnamed protein product [Macrosiphum euphorbiae]|uniref:Uncharacterized protein n=1 Tax=Macrosiphum euphorbiae TaxID=13131 RepID=A0AAV0WNL1_9HEMI|nr:unnamed protein product [Macrosiphum euphorbiae]
MGVVLASVGTHIEFDVFQCTVNDLVQSLTVDSRTVSKHMSRTSVRHDVILVHDTPRIVADVGRRPAAADGGEKNRRQPGSPGNPNRLSNRTMVRLGGGGDATAVVGRLGPILYRGKRKKKSALVKTTTRHAGPERYTPRPIIP